MPLCGAADGNGRSIPKRLFADDQCGENGPGRERRGRYHAPRCRFAAYVGIRPRRTDRRGQPNGVAQGTRSSKDTLTVEDTGACTKIDVGAPPEEALVCSEIEHVRATVGATHVYRVQFRRRVRVVRANRVVVILDVVETVTPLDKFDLEDPNLLDLDLQFASDGLSATLDDSNAQSAVGCTAALGSLSGGGDPVSSKWNAFDLALLKSACAARGRYVWKTGAFSREP
jgi:hypothetical protein